MKTGNTNGAALNLLKYPKPQWSPVMKTGNTSTPGIGGEYVTRPQWSPVMKTGNTLQGPGAGDKTWGCLNGARS